MEIKSYQLETHLNNNKLAPCYLVNGDDPLLVDEARLLLRKAARENGFTERQSFQAEKEFEWEQALASASNLSLFAERTLIEVRCELSQLNDKFLLDYLENPSSDCLLLISCERIPTNKKKTKWIGRLLQNCNHSTIWDIKPNDYPRWLKQRAQREGLDIKPAALKILAENTEGNLLAAVQELEKLKLLHGQSGIDESLMVDAIANSSRHNIFKLCDDILLGNIPQVIKTVRGLKSEGTPLPVILWAVTRELRTLIDIREGLNQKKGFDDLMQTKRIWKERVPGYRQTLKRLSSRQLYHQLQFAQSIDASIKGIEKKDPWLLCERLLLAMCAENSFSS